MTRQDAGSLAAGIVAGRRRALARAMTLVESGGRDAEELLALLHPHSGGAATVGVTGPPGAGKSTLVGALIAERRRAGRTVGVLAVDPSSPYTGGAVLGDRLRLTDHYEDPGVFIRSLAARGELGGLSAGALQAMVALDAFGFDEVVLETVGVGQSEVDVAYGTDTVVLVLIPGSGDSIQALKSGIMEIPDIVVVNKADHPAAETLVRDLRTALTHRGLAWRTPVVATEASNGRGVPELAAAVDDHARRLREAGELDRRRRDAARALVGAIVMRRVREAVDQALRRPGVEDLMARVAARSTDPRQVADGVLSSVDGRISGRPGGGGTAR